MDNPQQPGQESTEPADQRHWRRPAEKPQAWPQMWPQPPGQPSGGHPGTDQPSSGRPTVGQQATGQQGTGQQGSGQQGSGRQPADQPTGQQSTGRQWQPYWPTQSWTAPSTNWWPPAGSGTLPPPPPAGQQPAQGSAPAGRGRKHRAVPALVAAALVVAAAAGGVGIGHLVWPGTQSASGNPVELSSGSSSNSGSGNSSNGTGGSGSDQTQNGSGSTGSGSGGTGSGSTGSGGGSSGSSGTGGSGTGSSGDGNSDNGGNTDNGGNSDNGGGYGGGYGEWPGQWPGQGSGSSGDGSTQSGSISSADGAPADISGIRDKVDDAVVDIDVTFEYQQAEGAGTGIVLTSTGEILTNNHVIDGATSISVTDIGNGKTYQASVVGYDDTDDIAVLQLKDASGLATATIGDADSLAVGDAVVGIGNAGGVGGTPSAAGGSVTALNRSITVSDDLYGTSEKLKGLIEVNANIQSGDSGGPLVTSSGAVIGVDTAASSGVSRDGSSDGYAIPIDTAMSIVKTIESGTGTSTIHVGATAALGVLISTSDQSATGLQPGDLGGDEQSTKGALVAGVIDDGAAAKAGLAEGDIITSLGGHQVTSSEELSTLMSGYTPGQSVKIGWTDTDGQTHTKTITLGTGPAA